MQRNGKKWKNHRTRKNKRNNTWKTKKHQKKRNTNHIGKKTVQSKTFSHSKFFPTKRNVRPKREASRSCLGPDGLMAETKGASTWSRGRRGAKRSGGGRGRRGGRCFKRKSFQEQKVKRLSLMVFFVQFLDFRSILMPKEPKL